MNITHYMITESSAQPAADSINWVPVCTPLPDISITGGTFDISSGETTKTIYAWVKDDAGNVSEVTANSHFTVTLDKTAPVVTAFTTTAVFPVSGAFNFTLKGTDSAGITGWKVTETFTKPLSTDSGWTAISSQTSVNISGSYTPVMSGARNLYAWLKDAAGNVNEITNSSYLTFVFRGPAWNNLFVRDNIQDTGDLSHPFFILYASLDIIPWGANPISDFSNYSQSYSKPMVKNVDNNVFIRVKNLGTSAIASGTSKIYVYWTKSNLFGTPGSWNLMTYNGTAGAPNVSLPDLAAGAFNVTQTPSVWRSSMSGNFCVIAVVATDQFPWDPAHPLKFKNGANFTNLIKYSPNVCWRNVKIVNFASIKSSLKSQKQKFDDEFALTNEWDDPINLMAGITIRTTESAGLVGTLITIKICIVRTAWDWDDEPYDYDEDLKVIQGSVDKPGDFTMYTINKYITDGVRVNKGDRMKVKISAELPEGKKFNIAACQIEVDSFIFDPAQKNAKAGIIDVNEHTHLGSFTILFSDAPSIAKGRDPKLNIKPVKNIILGKPVKIKPHKPVKIKAEKIEGKKAVQTAAAKKPSAVKSKSPVKKQTKVKAKSTVKKVKSKPAVKKLVKVKVKSGMKKVKAKLPVKKQAKVKAKSSVKKVSKQVKKTVTKKNSKLKKAVKKK